MGINGDKGLKRVNLEENMARIRKEWHFQLARQDQWREKG